MNVYLDNAATTPICDAAKQAIIENMDKFYNPSSSYEDARLVKIKIESAREKIASLINAEPNEIYFTSGGSEANTWVMLNREYRISSIIEHSSLKSDLYFSTEHNGVVSLERIKDAFDKTEINCVLMSCMMINNEIGTMQPIKGLCEIAHEHNMLFHTDAVQAVGHIPIDVKALNIDMMSASAHKFGGIKGCGFLYIKNGIEMPRLIYGGKQELSMRGGTENVLGILSMAAALEHSVNNMEANTEQIQYLSNMIKNRMLNIEGVHLNGSDNPKERYCGNLNFRIDKVRASDFVALSDQFGVYISAGSACHEGEAKPSRTLKAIGLSDEEALSSIRISIGSENTEEEINYVCDLFPKIIDRLRDIKR